MSSSFFKKSLASSNIRISTHSGGRSVFDENGSMDDEYERRSFGGQGPRTGSYRGQSRGRGKNRGNKYQSYNQHDDRSRGSHSVTERMADRLGYRGRGRDSRGRRGAANSRSRGHGYDSRPSRDHHAPTNAPQWYQVTIPYGAEAGKDFIYREINDLLDIKFSPTSYREDGKAAIFFIELSFSSVEALKAINKRITLPNGFKMTLLVKQQDPPVPKVLEGELLEKLLTTMSNLYDTESKVLDLSSLHKNEGLKPECLPLNRRSVMTAVVSIIAEHIPELVALNLSHNRLTSLEILEKLVPNTPSLLGLDLSHNEVRDTELDRLKGWQLQELNMASTPVAKRYADNFNSYLSFVRKRFPKLLTLDGKEAPAPIVFEIDAVTAQGLPLRKGNFMEECDPACSQLVTQFINQYIELFDSDNRDHLIAAYDDDATFSTSFWFYPMEGKQHRFDISSSRNLLKIPSNERNGKRIHYGKQSVIDFFTGEFPRTKHLLETLNVDVVFQNTAMLSFTLSGLFEEPNSTKAHKITRMFSRNFTTVPRGEGIVIVSEQLSFTNASSDRRGQMLAAAKQREQAAAAPSTSTSSSSTTIDSSQKAMLQQFMKESGMNEHWSSECLVANSWSYEAGAAMYARLKAEGKIPPEAFQT
ncbi:nuclear RNA export factor 1-like [Watersipora subatra]|uniref:nuclear RNA export factor 1-like n=1 Tax=Watersipora subatra TaxID=2589382 RepID=UPI00355B5197